MSIYAGIPSGAYNSEAAMLYGGLAPNDFNVDMTFNLLVPWFTRNNIPEDSAGDIAQAVTDYLKVATAFRLRRDGSGLREFWKRFVAMAPGDREILRRAVNYVRHKKRIPLATLSRELAEAENWTEALPYLRAVPGIGRKVPRPLLQWINMSPLNREFQTYRWTQLVPEIDAVKDAAPPRLPFVSPTPEQIAALDRRRQMAAFMADQRKELRRRFPTPARVKKEYPEGVAELKQKIREAQAARTLRALQEIDPTATLQSTY